MKSKHVIFGFVALLLLVCSICVLFFGPSWWHHRQLIRQAQPVQLALESYRIEHSLYPESLTAAKITKPDEIYYRRQQDGSYILWFGTTLGESVTYHSTTHRWQ